MSRVEPESGQRRLRIEDDIELLPASGRRQFDVCTPVVGEGCLTLLLAGTPEQTGVDRFSHAGADREFQLPGGGARGDDHLRIRADALDFQRRPIGRSQLDVVLGLPAVKAEVEVPDSEYVGTELGETARPLGIFPGRS
jgi:hypothetical protein